MKADICRRPGIERKGVSGPTISGLSVPGTSISSPIACHAKPSFRARATSTCGQSSWNHAKPPEPATMCTLRLVPTHAASCASATPPVPSSTSSTFQCERP
jgi:hypothetical protein